MFFALRDLDGTAQDCGFIVPKIGMIKGTDVPLFCFLNAIHLA